MLLPQLSGVTLTVAKMSDYDAVYLQFYNMQRLILMYIYHELILPEELFQCADLPSRATETGAAAD